MPPLLEQPRGTLDLPQRPGAQPLPRGERPDAVGFARKQVAAVQRQHARSRGDRAASCRR